MPPPARWALVFRRPAEWQKLQKSIKNHYRVYALLGDGEMEEGSVWEALMFAAHYGLDNLCVMVDANGPSN